MARELKYSTLVNVLDRIRHEAPASNKKYHPKETELELLNQARSRAYIHLYLKVKYGILDFVKRERWITDGSSDGGIDAYFIDRENKTIDLIQSKFRTTAINFEEKEISFGELMSMDVDRILEGESCNELGNEYNGKIKQLQRELGELTDIGRYKYNVVILANLKEDRPVLIRKLTGGFGYTVFDHQLAYDQLLFPVVAGTYYSQETLCIPLDFANTSTSASRLSYSAKTEFKDCDISLVFVPTMEIGKILYQYKNSVLKFNPRSYLGLANNTVNKEIEGTITGKTTNEFALFNNGITMLSDETNFNERVAVKGKAQVVVTNPQILNGGQTAYTLSRIFEDVQNGDKRPEVFANKEVLVKIITFDPNQSADPDARLQLIEDISRTTNSQTPVTEADRRANDKVQVEAQHEIFRRYGRYYERKRGEFADGVRDGYIDRSGIVDREDFLRVCIACDGKPSQARRSSADALFREDNFKKSMTTMDRLDQSFLGYKCLEFLNKLEKTTKQDESDKWGVEKYGNALRYGKFAVVAACARAWESVGQGGVEQLVMAILGQWVAFEGHVRDLSENESYFPQFIDPVTSEPTRELNYDGYYKGRTVNTNVSTFVFTIDGAGGSDSGIAA